MQEYLDYIGDHCLAQGLTIAVAESVTAGYLQVCFSRATGATQFFQGGITAYNRPESKAPGCRAYSRNIF
jgi:nicotinamide-nucleotide amidase